MFNSVKMASPPKSRFDMSHDWKTTFNMGELVPVCLMPCMPGDKWNIGCESLIRFMPMLAPIYHRVDVTIHYFFCPIRILWDSWEAYITNGGAEPETWEGGTLPAFPYINMGSTTDDPGVAVDVNRLAKMMGIPIYTTGGVTDTPIRISAVPFGAYQLIYDEYYRDQNLISSSQGFPQTPYLNSGSNNALWTAMNIGQLKLRAWEHDYFTSCLPFAQKGTAVSVPLGNVEINPGAATGGRWVGTDDHLPVGAGSLDTNAFGDTLGNTVPETVLYDPNNTLQVGATAINDLRVAIRLQEWLEKNARGGTRYVENILVHFGVRSSDKRLQRPEYITGVKSSMKISEVLQTSESGAETPQGNMAGHGVGVVASKYGNYYCEEHGYIMGIMSVMPKSGYFQGIDRHWLMINDPTEFPWPSFANLGEQPVLNAEVFAWTAAWDDTFGYNPRYSEWKYMNNRSVQEFNTSLLFWTLDREFDDVPPLDAEFVSADVSDRIFAASEELVDSVLAYVHHNISVVRALPKYGTPTF